MQEPLKAQRPYVRVRYLDTHTYIYYFYKTSFYLRNSTTCSCTDHFVCTYVYISYTRARIHGKHATFK